MTAMAQSHDTIHHGLELSALSSTEWRVTDRHLPPSDAGSLVAFVEKIGSSYELMRFGDPIEFGSFATLDALVDHLAGAQASVVAPRTEARVTDLAAVRASHLAQQK